MAKKWGSHQSGVLPGECEALGMSTIQTSPGLTFAGCNELLTLKCGQCGVLFALPLAMVEARESDGYRFYCPNGHPRVFRDSIEKRLQRELEAERNKAARIMADRDQIKASLRAQKGIVTKMRKRMAEGVCPCCQQSFRDLAEHMLVKHPGFVKEAKSE